jgi:hypothetical protein
MTVRPPRQGMAAAPRVLSCSLVRPHSKTARSSSTMSKPFTVSAPVGHTAAHWPQPIQRELSVAIEIPVSLIASVGQRSTQREHPAPREATARHTSESIARGDLSARPKSTPPAPNGDKHRSHGFLFEEFNGQAEVTLIWINRSRFYFPLYSAISATFSRTTTSASAIIAKGFAALAEATTWNGVRAPWSSAVRPVKGRPKELRQAMCCLLPGENLMELRLHLMRNLAHPPMISPFVRLAPHARRPLRSTSENVKLLLPPRQSRGALGYSSRRRLGAQLFLSRLAWSPC